MREEHSASDEEPKTEVQQLQMPSWKRSGTATSEVPKQLQARKLGKSEWVVVQKMFCRKIWLVGWTRQTKFWDALGMADMESNSAITSLITRGSPRWPVSFHDRPHSRTRCRESVTGWGYKHQRGRGVPPWASPEKISLGSVQRQRQSWLERKKLEEVVVIRERSSHVRDQDGVLNKTVVGAFE